jgi:hypothetical protein
VVVNGKVIYPIPQDKPIEITIPTNPSKIVVTDGFHITQPFTVSNNYRQGNCYSIGCGIENDQLIVGLIIILLVYIMGAASGVWLFQLLSIVPILYFLFLYYIKKNKFIQIKQS